MNMIAALVGLLLSFGAWLGIWWLFDPAASAPLTHECTIWRCEGERR